MLRAQRKVTYGVFNRLLAPRHVLQPVLVAPEDIVNRDVGTAPLQVDSGEPFEVVEADEPLHRPPDLVVHLRRPGWQEHEDQVAQQVGLGEVDAGRVQRLEDAVRVVALARGDVDDCQPLDHDRS